MTNYKISEDNYKYKSIYVPECKKMIIGIPKDMDLSSVDTDMIIHHQIHNIDVPNYFDRIFELPSDPKGKRKVIECIMDYLDKRNKLKPHMGKILQALLSYFYAREGQSIEQTFKALCKAFKYYNSDFSSFMKKMKKPTFLKSTLLDLGYICAYNLISPSFLECGYGTLFVITEKLQDDKMKILDDELKKYLIEKYENFSDSLKGTKNNELNLDEIYNIKNFLDNSPIIKGNYEEWEIHTMFKNLCLDKLHKDLIDKLLD